MLQGWVVIIVAVGYIGLLFVIARYGDRARARHGAGARMLIYPLSLAIYCTSWTFFGSVGLASRNGYDFLTIYVGPIIMIGLASPLIAHIVRLAKTQNITSIADFIAARYGKHQGVAATVALIAIVGSIPYRSGSGVDRDDIERAKRRPPVRHLPQCGHGAACAALHRARLRLPPPGVWFWAPGASGKTERLDKVGSSIPDGWPE